MEPGVIAALASSAGALIGAIAVWIRSESANRRRESEQEAREAQWKQDVIDQQRQDMAGMMADRDAAHSREIDLLTRRVTDLETELKRLREDLTRRDEEIARVRTELEEAKRRIHQLELDNAKLDAQKTALIEQNSLLREQNAELYRMADRWNAFARQYIVKPAITEEPEEKAA